MSELWDIYDRNRNLTGKTIERDKHRKNKNEYHLVVHIWIKNKSNEWLISKRTPNKFFPLLWECTGGSVLAGEDSLTGALREVKEELGITLDKNKGKLYKSFRRDNYSDFCDVWVFEHNCDINEVVFQENETCDAMWASNEKIAELISNKQFVPLDNMKYVYELICNKTSVELNSIVTVTVDRPLGFAHPKHKDIIYPINYGYIKGIMANDGEYQDAYIVGVNEPVKTFTGKVIAVIERKNDVEDKLVAAPADMKFTKQEIEQLTQFQEKYFETEIIMENEK